MSRRPAPGQLALVFGLALMAALLWGRVVDPGGVAPTAIAGALLPVVVAAAVHSRGPRHTAVSSAAHLAGFAIVLVVATRSVSPATWWDGVAHGWSDLLSASLPAPPRPSILVFAAIIVTFTTAVAAETTIRTAAPLAPIAALVAGVCTVFLFGSRVAGRSLLEPAMFLGGGAVLLLLRSTAVGAEADAAAMRRRRVLGALPLAAAVVAAAAAVGNALPFLTDGRQVQLRDHWTTEDRPDPVVNPLGQVTRAAADAAEGTEGRRAFTVVLNRRLADVPRFRLVTLDVVGQFEWSSEPRFVALGSVVPDGPDPTPDGVEVRQEITVARTEGAWLPTLDRPTSVDAPLAAEVEVDPSTGQLIRGAAGGELSYRVTSVVPSADIADLVTTASPANDAAASHALRLPDSVPAPLQQVATELGAGSRSAWEQLARLIAFFDPSQKVQVGGRVVEFAQDPATVLGHSLASLEQFVTTSPGGTSEQFATAFAVLARLMGFPSRVVVGYVPSEPPAAGRRLEVRSTDLQAWPEVRLQGHGWVPIPFGFSTAVSTAPALPPDIASAVSDALDTPSTPEETPRTVNRPPEPAVADGSAWPGRMLAITIVALGLATILASPALLKRLRRVRRRRRGSTAERVGGAWLEAMDRLLESGVPQVSSLVPSEAVRASVDRLGVEDGSSLGGLGAVVQRALHAPTPPSEADVETAWSELTVFESAVASARSRRDSVRAALDPRPLVPGGRDDQGW